MPNRIIPVILCGGVGSRLWPLSTQNRPKQFIPLIAGKTPLQATLDRVNNPDLFTMPIIICNQKHRNLITINKDKAYIIAEPMSRNTAPAICAALAATEVNDVMLILPADHFIPDIKQFQEIIVELLANMPEDHIATIGIKPTHAHTGYGYIEKTKPLSDHIYKVRKFTEKPSADNAQKYANSGNHLWNTGILMARRETFVKAFMQHKPEILTTTRRAWKGDSLDPKVFSRNQSISIDYAVMERANNIVTYAADMQWHDLGSWKSLINALIRQLWQKK